MKWKALIAGAALLSGCATAAGPTQTWQSHRITDPVTDETRCIVLVPDRMYGDAFTRTGYLYPVVESNPEHGLLVGVSSGGKYPISPGDIIWRVDQNEPYQLMAAETPAIGVGATGVDVSYLPDDQQQALKSAMAEVMSVTNGMTSSIQNGVTLASGDKAAAMLKEMKSGSLLRFRPSAPQTGISGRQSNFSVTVIDGSFLSSLSECGL